MASQLSDGITSRGASVLIVTVTMIFLDSVFVLLRFMARRRSSVEGDDWVCLASLIVAYGFLITTVLMVTIGRGGNHIAQFQYDLPKLALCCQLLIASDVLAAASQSLAKVSILLFYQRIFAVSKRFRVATWVIGFLIFGYFVSTACGVIFASNPIEGEWKLWLPHTHIQHKAFWVSYGCINLLLDIIILCLPQSIAWRLNLSLRRKLQVSLVFLLGAFVCVTSIVRIFYISQLDMTDLTYSLLSGYAIWNVLEMTSGIICACLPIMPSLWRDFFHNRPKIDLPKPPKQETSLYQRPLGGSFSGPEASSQGQLWQHNDYTDIESTD